MTEPRKPVEIHCPSCQRDSLLIRSPRYEGFTRVGESASCAACGHVFEQEAEIPFKQRDEIKVFTASDRGPEVEVFRSGEADRLCRYCVHYLINPFTQWCSRHRREVEATDSCEHFQRKPAPKPGPL